MRKKTIIWEHPYSNYPEFIGLRKGMLVDSDFVKINLGAPEEYQAFVMDYVPPEKIQKELRHYLSGASDVFISGKITPIQGVHYYA